MKDVTEKLMHPEVVSERHRCIAIVSHFLSDVNGKSDCMSHLCQEIIRKIKQGEHGKTKKNTLRVGCS